MLFKVKMNGPLPSSVNSIYSIAIIDMGGCLFFMAGFNLWFNYNFFGAKKTLSSSIEQLVYGYSELKRRKDSDSGLQIIISYD